MKAKEVREKIAAKKMSEGKKGDFSKNLTLRINELKKSGGPSSEGSLKHPKSGKGV